MSLDSSELDGETTIETAAIPVQDLDLEEDEVTEDVLEARAQVEQTRAELTDTIDQIKDRLSPQNLVAEAKEATVGKAQEVLSEAVDSAKEKAATVTTAAKNAINDAVATAKPMLRNAGETVKETGVSIVETIKLNPLPAAITGFGLAWLLMSAHRQSATASNYGRGESDAYELPSDTDADRFTTSTDEFGAQNNFATSGAPSGTLSDTVSSKLDTMKDSLSDAKDKVTKSASDMAHNVAQKASDLGGQAKDQAQRAVGATGDFFQSYPLAMGAIALLAGAAIGLMIPGTEPENRLMGETRDRLKDQATEQLHQVADKVQNVAQTAYNTAKNTVQQTVRDEARNQGLTTASA